MRAVARRQWIFGLYRMLQNSRLSTSKRTSAACDSLCGVKSWLRHLVTGFSPRRSRFNSRAVCVGFVVDSVEAVYVYFRVTMLSLIVIPLSIYHSEDGQWPYKDVHIHGDLLQRCNTTRPYEWPNITNRPILSCCFKKSGSRIDNMTLQSAYDTFCYRVIPKTAVGAQCNLWFCYENFSRSGWEVPRKKYCYNNVCLGRDLNLVLLNKKNVCCSICYEFVWRELSCFVFNSEVSTLNWLTVKPL
jgi:hypothetical protein